MFRGRRNTGLPLEIDPTLSRVLSSGPLWLWPTSVNSSGLPLWVPVHLWFQVRQLQCFPRSFHTDIHWTLFYLFRSMGCWWLYSGCHPTQPLSAQCCCWQWSEANESLPTTAQETFPLLCASLSPGVRHSSELVLFLHLGSCKLAAVLKGNDATELGPHQCLFFL